MFGRVLHIMQYHNATNWLLFGFLFVGLGTAFAATDSELRQAATDTFISESETITQVDNSALLEIDLELFDPELRIVEVVEDDDNYYAAYTFATLMLENGAWKETQKSDTLAVNKELLSGHDLGLYLADELGEVTNQELAFLREVQALERKKGATRKTVAIAYGGLIGRFLDPQEVEFDGYEPVIAEPERENVPLVTQIPVPATPSETPQAIEQQDSQKQASTEQGQESSSDASQEDADDTTTSTSTQLTSGDVVDTQAEEESADTQVSEGEEGAADPVDSDVAQSTEDSEPGNTSPASDDSTVGTDTDTNADADTTSELGGETSQDDASSAEETPPGGTSHDADAASDTTTQAASASADDTATQTNTAENTSSNAATEEDQTSVSEEIASE